MWSASEIWRHVLFVYVVFVIAINGMDDEEHADNYVKFTELSNSDVANMKKFLKYFEQFGLDHYFENHLKGSLNAISLESFQNSDFIRNFKAQNISSACKLAIWKEVQPALQYIVVKDLKKLLEWFFTSPLAYYLDSWAKVPTRILMGHTKWNGAFDECNSIDGSHYCLADMILLSTKNPPGQFGTCAPMECSATDVLSILQITQPKLSGFIDFPENGTFFEKYGASVICNDKKKLSTDTLALIVICSLLGFMCLLGTITESLQDCFTPDRLIPTHSLYQSQENDAEENNLPGSDSCLSGVNNSTEDLSYARFGTEVVSSVTFTRGNSLTNFLIAFSVLKNTKALLNTNVARGTITSINGIRAISMTWVILGHIYFFGISTAPDNISAAFKINQRFSYQAIANAYVSVDSFFFLSGFLVAYIALKNMDKNNGKLNFFKFVFHRFVRLTPSYAFAIFVYTSLYPVILNSPEGLLVRAGSSQCHKYWWTNLLYINNFYPTAFLSECLGWSWYLANDMQFYIISPIFLLAMYHFKFLGAVISTGLGIVICVAATMGIVGGNDLPALLSEAWLPTATEAQRAKVEIMADDVYCKPYTRIAPYLVGLFLGYILSRKIYLTRKPNFLVTLIGWTVATGIGIAVIYGPYSVFKPDGTMFGTAQNILYASLSRLAWALALAWVVYACQYKRGGIVNHFLSWSVWTPLSRLTYGAYLFHPIVLNYYYKTMDNPWHFQDDTTIFRFLSVTVVSYSLSFITALLIELPVYNLERKLMKA